MRKMQLIHLHIQSNKHYTTHVYKSIENLTLGMSLQFRIIACKLHKKNIYFNIRRDLELP